MKSSIVWIAALAVAVCASSSFAWHGYYGGYCGYPHYYCGPSFGFGFAYAPAPVYYAPPPVVYYAPPVVVAAPEYVQQPTVVQPPPVVQQPAPAEQPRAEAAQPAPAPQQASRFAETRRRFHTSGSNAGRVDWVEGLLDGRPVRIYYDDFGRVKKQKWITD